jgi:mono/diheme cytochrome c family protein
MWNHAPAMWASMKDKGIQPKELREQDAADLIAYFYSARFFERPADAGRGKQVFASKKCETCHQLSGSAAGSAKPVSQWQSLGQTVDLAEAMWNHASQMQDEFARRKISWQQLTAQEMGDLLIYLRNLPSTRSNAVKFEISAGDNGKALFEQKGCAGCHTGKLDLTHRLKDKTLNDIAVDMWNHAPQMAKRTGSTLPKFAPGEMNSLLSYVWAQQFFEDSGDATKGKKVFASHSCGSCHGVSGSGAPDLARSTGFSSVSMVSSLWRHGPAMQEKMRSQNKPWPKFSSQEMSDLIAYLNTGTAGK